MPSPFIFSKSERNGIWVLSILIVVLIAANMLFPYVYPFSSPDTASIERKLDSLFAARVTSLPQHTAIVSKDRQENTYSLDSLPHHADSLIKPIQLSSTKIEDWTSIGVPEKVAKTLVNYRSKGGQFKSIDELTKIYGFSPDLLQDVRNKILIETPKPTKITPIEFNPEDVEKIDLNSADCLTLIKVRGIGPAYAKKIIKFRDALGGFTAVEQLKETYGLHPDAYEVIAPQVYVSSESVKKININVADYVTINRHPYIDNQQAKAIFEYRNKHGEFKSLDQLHKIYNLDSLFFERALPYLTIYDGAKN